MSTDVDVEVATGLVYGTSDQRMDVYQSANASTASPVVVLWHGRGPDERDVLAPLARTAARLGLLVLVPDWRPDAPDGGLNHLGESVAFARENAGRFGGDPGQIALAGWSLGANAALGVALDPSSLGGWRPRAVVGIAGGYRSGAPTAGIIPITELARTGAPVPPIPVCLVHGTADQVVGIEQSRELREVLEERDWPVSLDEVATDHAGVVMTEYSPDHQRCLPSAAGHVMDAGTRTAHLLARAAGAVPR